MVHTCPTGLGTHADYPVIATDSLIINGNDSVIDGRQSWITDGGHINTKVPSCSDMKPSAGFTLLSVASGFLQIGKSLEDNGGLTVVVNNLSIKRIGAGFSARNNASLVLNNTHLSEVFELGLSSGCDTPVVYASSASLSLISSSIRDSWTVGLHESRYFPLMAHIGGVIFGDRGSVLTMQDSRIAGNLSGPFLYWDGEIDIVNSFVSERVGMTLYGTGRTSNVVNSIFLANDSDGLFQRFIAADTALNIKASTLYFSALLGSDTCATCTEGAGIKNIAGNIHIEQTAIGSFLLANNGPLFYGDMAGITTDTNTWLQPTYQQTATDLSTLFPNAQLGVDQFGAGVAGLPNNDISGSFPNVVTPVLSGALIDAIDTAASGQVNALLNPIDNAFISNDALGNARVDANDKRNIGAVQLQLASHLQVKNSGDAYVDLSWNRPVDPSSGTISGYALMYREAGSSASFTRFDIPGALILDGSVLGLENGIEYEFKVLAVNSAGDGPDSNTVMETPYGSVSAPEVAAIPSDKQVTLTWVQPDSGGRDLLSYSIKWRELGVTKWEGSQLIVATEPLQAIVTNLDNNKTYEFGVAAISAQSITSATSFVEITPYGAITVEAKGGGGSIGLIDVLLVGLLFGLKFRRHLTAFVCLLVTLTAPVQAGQSNIYVSVGLGNAGVSTGALDAREKILVKTGAVINSFDYDRTDTSYLVNLGFVFHDNWALEAGYYDFGKPELEVQANAPDQSAFVEAVSEVIPGEIKGIGLSALGRWGLVDSFSIRPRLGMMFWDSEFDSVSVGSSNKSKDHGVDLLWGAGVTWEFKKDIDISFEYTRLQLSDYLENYGLTISWKLPAH